MQFGKIFLGLLVLSVLQLAYAANSSCTEDCCATLHSRPPQAYTFYQNTGRFRGGSGEWAVNTLAYSGQGKGYLNPDYQCVVNTGPLPATLYKMATCQNIMHQTVQRPCSFYLEPQRPSEMCGRSDFLVHGCDCCTSGDDSNPPAAGCSAGCVVLSYVNRKKLRIGDTLTVVHYEPKRQDDQQPQVPSISTVDEASSAIRNDEALLNVPIETPV